MSGRFFISVLLFAWLTIFFVCTAWGETPFEQGMTLFENGKYKEAAVQFEMVIQANPANQKAMTNLGDCYLNLYSDANPEYATAAIEAYQKSLKLNPNDGFTRLCLAQVYVKTKDIENAVAQLEALLKNEPSSTAAMNELAEIYSWKPETFNNAISYSTNVLSVDPENVRANLVIARIYSWKGKHGESLKHFEKILEQEPDRDSVRLEYANELTVSGRFNEAVTQFDYLSKREKVAVKGMLGMAKAYFLSKRFKDAMAIVESVLENSPDNADAFRLKGLIFAEQHNIHQATEAFQKAIELEPDDAELKVFLARVFAMDPATSEKAVSIYESIIEKWPDNIEARTELARYYSFAKNHDKAIEHFGYLLEKNPDDAMLRAEFVKTYLRANQFESAVAQCEKLIKLSPEKYEYRFLLGEVYLGAGLYDKALDVYGDILDKKENYLPALVGLGWARHKMGMHHRKIRNALREDIQNQWIGFFDGIAWLYHYTAESWHNNRAVAVLTETTQRYPTSTEPYLRMAEINCERMEIGSAISNFEKAISIDPNSYDAYLGMAWVYAKTGNKNLAVNAIGKATSADPGNMRLFAGLGQAYIKSEEIRLAMGSLEKSLVSNYSDIDLHRRIARLYAGQIEYSEKAITECQYILQQDPSDNDTRLLLARMLRKTGHYKDALLLYQKIMADNESEKGIYLEMIDVKIDSQGAENVARNLLKALQEDPFDVLAREALAKAYLAMKDLDKAEKEFLIVIKADTNSSYAHLGLADINRLRGRFKQARAGYDNVLKTASNSSHAYFGLGIMARETGQYDRAIQLFSKALENSPDNVETLAELAYGHYLLARMNVENSSQNQMAWWSLSSNWSEQRDLADAQAYDSIGGSEKIGTSLGATDCETRFNAARRLEADSRTREAIEHYRRLLSDCPDHMGARVALADIFSVSPSTYDKAINQALEIINRDPDNFDAHLRLAKLYSWSNKYTAAAAQYRWCLKEKPDSVEFRNELVNMLEGARHYNEALEQVQVILDKDPNRDDVRMKLAMLKSKTNNIDQAISEYRKILKQDPDNYQANISLARLYASNRAYHEDAVNLYRRLLVRFPDQTNLRGELGKLLYSRGEYASAQRAIGKPDGIAPESYESHIMLGKIYMAKSESDEAIKEFRSVLVLMPDNLEAKYNLAMLYSKSPATYEKAHALGSNILKDEQGNEEIRVMMARVCFETKDFVSAAEHYEKLLQKEPNNGDYLWRYALCLRGDGRNSEAVEIFEKLVAENPKDLNLTVELGLAHLAGGGFNKAISYLKGAVEKMPWDVRARRGLARACKGAGQIEEAVNHYKRILIIDPADQESIDFLAEHNITYIEGAMLNEFYNYPGKGDFRTAAAGPENPIAPYYMDEVDQAVLTHKLMIAEQLMVRDRLKRARYVYEKLAEKYPDDPRVQLGLAELYAAAGMWSSAKERYDMVLKVSPNNRDALCGLSKVKYDSSPTMEYYTGITTADRAVGDMQCEIKGGGRFTYKFGDNSEVYGGVTVAHHTEENGADPIDRMSPMIGIKVGLFGEVQLRGEYSYNRLNRSDDTHNYMGALKTNIYDAVGLEGYYYRDDVRQTVMAMENGIGRDNAGGVLEVYPVAGLRLRTEYRHSNYDKAENIEQNIYMDQNTAQLGSTGVNYTFLDGPYITTGYMYTAMAFEKQNSGDNGIYWAPEYYQNHALPIEVMGFASNFYYFAGTAPSYNLVQDDDDSFGLSVFAGFDWEVAIAHRLGVDANTSIGVGESLYEYQALLKYTYLFGNHSGLWKH